MTANERRPTWAPSETPAKVSVSIVPQQVQKREHTTRLPLPPVSVIELDLLSITTRERDCFDAGWYWGYRTGIDAGRAQVADEDELHWQDMRAFIRKLGGPFSRPWSEVCDLRNEPERAAAARAHEARVAAGVDLERD